MKVTFQPYDYMIITSILLSLVLSVQADLTNAGLGGLAHIVFPVTLGLISLIVWFILRLLVKVTTFRWLTAITLSIVNIYVGLLLMLGKI